MHATPLLSGMSIDKLSATPKHLQLAEGFLSAIDQGTFRNNDIVPSLNALKNAYDIPRVTAEKCYKHLRHIGVLESFPGKGYYFKNVNSRHTTNVLLLFNRLSAHKQIIYNSFVQTLGKEGSIDLAVYDNNFSRFSNLIAERKDAYAEYVVIPHFTDNSRALKEVINKIPRSKLILLDKTIDGVEGDHGAIFENFENDIYEAMGKAMQPLLKYHSIHIIFPSGAYYPKEILTGLERFCNDRNFAFKAISDASGHKLEKGVAYITVMEDDLVTIIEKAGSQKLAVGSEIGVISYNETPLKKLILKGITTISTDFALMGRLAAEMIVNRKKTRHALPFTLTLRSSL